jgi:hypothetical protein
MSADADTKPTDTRPRDQQERDLTKQAKKGEPHSELSNPVGEPDPTEWPDPYEQRRDPRGPDAAESPAGPSSSEPPPPRNVDDARREERGDEGGA